MAHVLVVGADTPAVQSALAAISSIGATPLTAPDFASGREALGQEVLGLVVLDVSQVPPQDPDLAGFLDACRDGGGGPPIFALAPASELAAYVGEAGFDDFAVSPFRQHELAVRIQRLLRRAPAEDEGQVLRIADLVIDISRYEVTQAGRRMELTFKEYELLKFLATNPDKVFTREALLNQVWGYDYFGGTRTVDVHIRRLRSKIENGPTTFIDTVRNVGYRFIDYK